INREIQIAKDLIRPFLWSDFLNHQQNDLLTYSTLKTKAPFFLHILVFWLLSDKLLPQSSFYRKELLIHFQWLLLPVNFPCPTFSDFHLTPIWIDVKVLFDQLFARYLELFHAFSLSISIFEHSFFRSGPLIRIQLAYLKTIPVQH